MPRWGRPLPWTWRSLVTSERKPAMPPSPCSPWGPYLYSVAAARRGGSPHQLAVEFGPGPRAAWLPLPAGGGGPNASHLCQVEVGRTQAARGRGRGHDGGRRQEQQQEQQLQQQQPDGPRCPARSARGRRHPSARGDRGSGSHRQDPRSARCPGRAGSVSPPTCREPGASGRLRAPGKPAAAGAGSARAGTDSARPWAS